MKQQAGQQMLNRYLGQEQTVQTRPFKTNIGQLVRTFIRSFELMNFGKRATYIYLPADLYDHFTDVIEDEFRAAGVPEHALDQFFRYFYLGIEVLKSRTNDIIVTDELLP
jgi:hypothetical protein